MWFAGAEEVEVGAVEEEDAFGHLHFFFSSCSCCMLRRYVSMWDIVYKWTDKS